MKPEPRAPAALSQELLFDFVVLQLPGMQVFSGVDTPVRGQWRSVLGDRNGHFPLGNALLPVLQLSWPPSSVSRSGGEALGCPTAWVAVGDRVAACTGRGGETTILADWCFTPCFTLS